MNAVDNFEKYLIHEIQDSYLSQWPNTGPELKSDYLRMSAE